MKSIFKSIYSKFHILLYVIKNVLVLNARKVKNEFFSMILFIIGIITKLKWIYKIYALFIFTKIIKCETCITILCEKLKINHYKQ